MKPRVSVIIPSYNHARFLAEAIDSVLSQDYPDIEIVVINDGSTDSTADVARSFGDRIVFIDQANAGVSNARNAGMSRATGEFIAFLDGDDVLFPIAISRRAQFLIDRPEVGMVVGNLSFMTIDGVHLSTTHEGGMTEPTVISLEQSFLRNWGGTCGTMFRKSLLETTGMMDPRIRIGEDWDLQIRFAAASQLLFDPEPVASARTIQGSLSRSRVRMFDDAQFMLNKNKGLIADPRLAGRLIREALFQQTLGMHVARVLQEVKGPKKYLELLRPLFSRPAMTRYVLRWACGVVARRLVRKGR